MVSDKVIRGFSFLKKELIEVVESINSALCHPSADRLNKKNASLFLLTYHSLCGLSKDCSVEKPPFINDLSW